MKINKTRLLALRAKVLSSVPDDPLELLDTLHHLRNGAGAVDELPDLRMSELVGSD